MTFMDRGGRSQAPEPLPVDLAKQTFDADPPPQPTLARPLDLSRNL